MNILGISALYHDSAACLLKDGTIVAALQEERLTRLKHDSQFPLNAINWCLSRSNITIKDVDAVVFYEKPFVKFERILETSVAQAPRGSAIFLDAMPPWLKQKIWLSDIIKKQLGYKGEILFTGHHEAHAASAFYPSPFQEAAFLTVDGVGEWETTTFGIGRGKDMAMLCHLDFPHSLGLLYAAFTYYLGFHINDDEYKVMGLAPYGIPRYFELILDKLLDLKDDASFKLNMDYFGYTNGLKMIDPRFERLFGGPARQPETEITQRHMDIAASVQELTQERILRTARYVHDIIGKDKLCLSGGVALNCAANGLVLREGPFKKIWIQPASGDAGAALGAAFLVWHKYYNKERRADEITDKMKGASLGPAFTDEFIEVFLKGEGIYFRKLSPEELPDIVSGLIADGKIIGWFKGEMEFGPRALGSRSILADARRPDMLAKINDSIKYRESFRPLAPSILKDYAKEWFGLEQESPYMSFTVTKQENRSRMPAVTHVDNSSRIQTVDKDNRPIFYALLLSFHKKTGFPAIINTSFNVRGEPMVNTPKEAYACFMNTEIDYLLLGHYLLDKKEMRQNLAGKEKKPITLRAIVKKTGEAVVWAISRLILTIAFYLFVTPLGLFLKLCGQDLLDLTIDKEGQTYWKKNINGAIDPRSYEKPF